MQKFNDDTVRGKAVKRDEIPVTMKVSHLSYKHKVCDSCQAELELWTKEQLIWTLITERKEL